MNTTELIFSIYLFVPNSFWNQKFAWNYWPAHNMVLKVLNFYELFIKALNKCKIFSLVSLKKTVTRENFWLRFYIMVLGIAFFLLFGINFRELFNQNHIKTAVKKKKLFFFFSSCAPSFAGGVKAAAKRIFLVYNLILNYLTIIQF